MTPAELREAVAQTIRDEDGCGAWLSATERVYCDDERLSDRCVCNCRRTADRIIRLVVERCAREALETYPRGSAHTYASENADVYVAQEAACERAAARIRALAPKDPAP